MKNFYLFFIFLFIFVCSCGNKNPLKNHIQTLVPEMQVRSFSMQGDSLLLCAEDKVSKAHQLYLHNIKMGRTELVHQTPDWDTQCMPAHIDGKNIVWCEYVDSQEYMGQAGCPWALYTMNLEQNSGPVLVFSNKDHREADCSYFDIKGNYIVFEYLVRNREDDFDSPLYLYNIKENKVLELVRETGFDLQGPSFDALDISRVVYSKCASNEAGDLESRLAIINIHTRDITPVEVSSRAYQASLNGDHVVFKEAPSLFHYGPIVLYNLRTQESQILSSHSLGGDFPCIGRGYVSWHDPGAAKVELYEISTGQSLLLDQGYCGGPKINGGKMIWSSSLPGNDNVIRYLDLYYRSKPFFH